ncbi:hypothetical protein CRUP_028924 [Coryphaenoides rupestris]|nr:hypothetical protein CRUP_028924 [Coryphaenoides rupestris]
MSFVRPEAPRKEGTAGGVVVVVVVMVVVVMVVVQRAGPLGTTARLSVERSGHVISATAAAGTLLLAATAASRVSLTRGASLRTPPSFVEVLLGDPLTLSCGAHGNPRPTVVWHKDETPIETQEKVKRGGVISEMTHTLLSPASGLKTKGPPIIVLSPGDTTLNMSQDATLQCQADAYPSNLTYEWLKQGQNVYHVESLKSRAKVLVDGTLLIPNLLPEDAGNYTCVPTNGILTPPSASALLKVKHPARVGRMSRETLLPAGMEGVIVCPVQADPPMLYFPGWMVNSEGSVFITTVNDNAVGIYTCTAYNSYGTMGQSEPTLVVLKNGSLLLQPLSKDHHGGWECLATNHVATVRVGTVVMALGTSPHAVTSVSVSAEMNRANVSWEPGFGRGVLPEVHRWVKQASRGKHEWASLPVPTSKDNLLVTGLLAATSYQFSVLHKEQTWLWTLHDGIAALFHSAAHRSAAGVVTLPTLDPPALLSANGRTGGVLLRLRPVPVTGYVLQAPRDQGQWVILSSDLGANQSDMLDSSYDLRLMSRSNKILSVPSESVNVSTEEWRCTRYVRVSLEFVLSRCWPVCSVGCCFLFMAIVLALSPPASPEPRQIPQLKLCPTCPSSPAPPLAVETAHLRQGSRGEYQDQRKQLLSNSSPPPHYTLFESHLGFSPPGNDSLKNVIVQVRRGQWHPEQPDLFRDSPKSSILSSEKEERKDSPLTWTFPN